MEGGTDVWADITKETHPASENFQVRNCRHPLGLWAIVLVND